MTRLGLALACASLLATTGCAVGGRLSLAPTVDTDGNPGVEVRLTTGFGSGGRGSGGMLVGTIAGGVLGDHPVLAGGVELDGEINADEIGVDFGIGFAHRQLYTPGPNVNRPGFVARFGVHYNGVGGEDTSCGKECLVMSLGLGIRAEILGGPNALGVFAFPLSFGLFGTATPF